MPFSKHAPGCTPLKPCNVCRAASFLKGKLRPADFAELVRLFDGGAVATPAATPETLYLDLVHQGISVRLRNCLFHAGKLKIGDLKGVTHAKLLSTPNFSKRSVNELIKFLASHGLELNAGLLAAE
ncbi:hypothetical protein FJY94_03850 [Candidatus Kaiserbacteria bacterium]|nr:hypothetical protein [Candidatus Kaiserbacteria bacterium]